jgi:soluble lytic murein transglycosylase-like protein
MSPQTHSRVSSRLVIFLLLLAVMASVVGCAGLNLTPDELARSSQPENPPVVDEYAQQRQFLSALEQQYGLPAGLLDAVWAQESGRGQRMRSAAGARGHFQFMPATAKRYGLVNHDEFEQSARAAARMYADLLKLYNGNLTKALAGYNWGSGNVSRKGIRNMPKETRAYIASITSKMQAQRETLVAFAGS